MRYIDVTWHHQHQDEPVRLVSELDDGGFEVRKLEYFRSGKVGFARLGASSLGTELGIEKCPPLAEIVSQEEFSGKEISAEQFESLWRASGG